VNLGKSTPLQLNPKFTGFIGVSRPLMLLFNKRISNTTILPITVALKVSKVHSGFPGTSTIGLRQSWIARPQKALRLILIQKTSW